MLGNLIIAAILFGAFYRAAGEYNKNGFAWGFIGLAAFALVVPIMFVIKWLWAGRNPKANIDINWDFHDPTNILFALLYFGLVVYLSNGYTLGKRLFKIRVVSLVHDRITLWQAMERALGYGASVLEAGFGFIQYFINSNRCCVHDRIAETIVVKVVADNSGQ